jgi:predicted SAM-dependent methyltransferase
MIVDWIIMPRLIKYSGNSVKLNLGCGDNKLPGFINIDSFAGVKPDLVHNIIETPLPYKDNSVDEVVFFHCIEHIPEHLHERVLGEIFRVLKKEAKFLISYPEFLKCVENYKTNLRGHRKFWKATIYGRQSHAGDYHVTLMDTRFFKQVLKKVGFEIVKVVEESKENPYNTLIHSTKQKAWVKRKDLLRAEIFGN